MIEPEPTETLKVSFREVGQNVKDGCFSRPILAVNNIEARLEPKTDGLLTVKTVDSDLFDICGRHVSSAVSSMSAPHSTEPNGTARWPAAIGASSRYYSLVAEESSHREEDPSDLSAMVKQYVELTASIERKMLHTAILSAFETVPGDSRFCVRRIDVVEQVARVRGIKVINNRVFADVQRAARELGWESIKNGGRSLFRCVKRTDQDIDEALMVSRSNRRDPRFGQRSNDGAADADHLGELGTRSP